MAETMVREFQERTGIGVDGKIGKQTAKKIQEVFNLEYPWMMLGQMEVESASFTAARENGNYSSKQLKKVFSYYANRPAEADEDQRKEKVIFNKVYADKNRKKGYELGNTQPEDGWYFRGNGGLGLTGRRNHKRFENWLVEQGLCNPNDIMLNPDLVWQKFYFESAYWFFLDNNLLNITDVKTLSKRVNGTEIHLDERKAATEKYRKMF